jgi:hypothetical protein
MELVDIELNHFDFMDVVVTMLMPTDWDLLFEVVGEHEDWILGEALDLADIPVDFEAIFQFSFIRKIAD